MRRSRVLLCAFALLLFSTPFWAARPSYMHISQIKSLLKDTLLPKLTDSLTLDSTIVDPDSLALPVDSLPVDSLLSDTTKKKKSGLDATVDFKANDSIIFESGNWGYLYGASEVYYTNLNLKAERMILNMDSSLVWASFGLDTAGQEFGYPIFDQEGTTYESKEMKYNFKTGKGFTRHTVTEQGEGYVVAGESKKNPDNSFFMTNGKYTTCDHHDHPHFYFKMTKAKVTPGKNVVFGPGYLVIEDLPIPFLGVPFGFFPFTKKYSSGVILPSFVDDFDRGFALHDGGYYFAINDHVDLRLTGEIYTKGSWGVNARSSYKKMYKYSGNVDFGYQYSKYGDKGVDQSVTKSIRLNWSHSQDPKANMYRTISANVQYSSSAYNRNQLNMLGTPNYTEDQKSSSVNITQKIPNTPWTISASMSVNQQQSTEMVSLTLPDVNVSMSRIYPFKRKSAVGEERWYEKIYMGYTANIRNSIRTKEDSLFKSDIRKDWQNGIKHNIPIGATFSVLNYLNITPSFNYTERWYTQKVNYHYDRREGKIAQTDTVTGFNRVYDFNFNLSFETKVYGMYTPLFLKNKIDRIRHVFSPSISFSYQPDFGDPKYGAYEPINYFDEYGHRNEFQNIYSPYSRNIFGTAPRGKQSSINFSFKNNLEMKIRTANDSLKKISLIDDLGVNFSYNMAADSFKLSNIGVNMRLKLSKSLTVALSGQFDPYLYEGVKDEYGQITRLRQVDKLRISNGKGFGRLISTSYSISPSINQDTFKKWFGKGDNKDKNNKNQNRDSSESGNSSGGERSGSLLQRKTEDEGEYDDDGYLKNEIKWNVNFNYGMRLTQDMNRIDLKNMEYKRKLVHNFGLSGQIQPTKNWNLSFSADYDFDNKRFIIPNISISRDLHCWNLSANFSPSGNFFYVKLSASSQMLQDLKYEERSRRSSLDPEWD